MVASQFMVARVYLPALLLTCIVSVTSLGDLCDNKCREVRDFYDYESKYVTRIEEKECLNCVYGRCGQWTVEKAGTCKSDPLLARTIRVYWEGSPFCDPVEFVPLPKGTVEGGPAGDPLRTTFDKGLFKCQ